MSKRSDRDVGGVAPRWVVSAVSLGQRALGHVDAASGRLGHAISTSALSVQGAGRSAAVVSKRSGQLGSPVSHATGTPFAPGEPSDAVGQKSLESQQRNGLKQDQHSRPSDGKVGRNWGSGGSEPTDGGTRAVRPSMAVLTGSGGGARRPMIGDFADRTAVQPAAPGRDGGAGEMSRRVFVAMGAVAGASPDAQMPVTRRPRGDMSASDRSVMVQRGVAAISAATPPTALAANSVHSRSISGAGGGLQGSGATGGTPQGVRAVLGASAPVATAVRQPAGQSASGGGGAQGGDGTAAGSLASATAQSPAATGSGGGSQAGGGGPTEGDVYLDGTLVGRWMARTLARAAGRPASGGAAFDPTRSRLPVGAMIGA